MTRRIDWPWNDGPPSPRGRCNCFGLCCLYIGGVSLVALAAAWKRSPQLIRRALQRHGTKIRPQGRPPRAKRATIPR